MKMDNENDAVISEDVIIGKMVNFLHMINLDMMKISLIVLIDGGAEMFIAIKINHQNAMLGVIVINPLNRVMFRE